MKDSKNIVYFAIAAIGLLVLPLLLQSQGNAWVRIADIALLYVLLALGLNIVVGYAGLLDLGYVAFFAIGAYLFALLGVAAPDRHLPGDQGHVPERAAQLAAARDPARRSGWRRCSACCSARPRSSCAATTWRS